MLLAMALESMYSIASNVSCRMLFFAALRQLKKQISFGSTGTQQQTDVDAH